MEDQYSVSHLVEKNKKLLENYVADKVTKSSDLLKLAFIFEKNNNPVRAEAVYKDLLARFDYFWEGYNCYAVFLHSEERYEESLPYLQFILDHENLSIKDNNPPTEEQIAKAYNSIEYAKSQVLKKIEKIDDSKALKDPKTRSIALSIAAKSLPALKSRAYYEESRQINPKRAEKLHGEGSTISIDAKVEVINAKPSETKVYIIGSNTLVKEKLQAVPEKPEKKAKKVATNDKPKTKPAESLAFDIDEEFTSAKKLKKATAYFAMAPTGIKCQAEQKTTAEISQSIAATKVEQTNTQQFRLTHITPAEEKNETAHQTASVKSKRSYACQFSIFAIATVGVIGAAIFTYSKQVLGNQSD